MRDEIRYVRSVNARIAYRVAGSGMPLFIVSGLGDSMKDWKESIIRTLAKRFCVILPDNRGIGLTGMGSLSLQKMTIARYAEDMHAVVEAEGFSEIFLLGHSMGGMIAQEFTAMYPGMVKKLMLFATDYGPESSYRARLMNRCVHPLQARCVIAPWHTKGFLTGACAIAAWPGSGDRLRDIACPTFLLFGDADFLMHPDVAYEMQKMTPHAELKMIPGGTHRMHDLCPTEFAKTALAFFGT